MRWVAAPLAAVLAAIALGACGGDGAEPGAPEGATLVLDFQPNAVHAGLYAAEENGYFEDEGLDLEIQEPSSTADGAKLLEAGRADFAIMDINDLGIARERGLDIVGIAAIVQRPLASVIAADSAEIRDPGDLAGATIGVTGVPSDDAVLDTVLASGGVPPDDVDRKTIGFKSVPLLASGKVDAATAFWNAEGVELKGAGVPTREFRVDELGAPRYPELVVAMNRAKFEEGDLACRFYEGLFPAYDDLQKNRDEAIDALVGAVDSLDEASVSAQLDALLAGHAFNATPNPISVQDPFLRRGAARRWASWAADQGVISQRNGLLEGFPGHRPACPPAEGYERADG